MFVDMESHTFLVIFSNAIFIICDAVDGVCGTSAYWKLVELEYEKKRLRWHLAVIFT